MTQIGTETLFSGGHTVLVNKVPAKFRAVKQI